MSVSEPLLKKIKALLDKAGATDSQAEAESFIAKANELLLKHNLEMSSLENISQQEGVEGTECNSLQDIKEHGTYDENIISALSSYNFLDLIWDYRGGKKSFRLIGEKSNIEITLYLFDFLKNNLPKIGNKQYSDKVIELRKEYQTLGTIQTIVEEFEVNFPELGDVELKDLMPTSYKESDKNVYQVWMLKDLKFANLPSRSVYLRSFLLGCANGLKTRLKAERESLIKNQVVDVNSTALTIQSLILKKEQANEAFIAREFKNIQTVVKKGESASNSEAFKNGIEAGKSIQFAKGLTNTAISQKELAA